MLFLFDNNGIDYWLHNNINDCCNSSISYNNENKDLELDLDIDLESKLELEMPTIKQKSNLKNINNNYKQNKNNLITEKYNYNANVNKEWKRNISSSPIKYNTSQKTQNNNRKDKFSLLGSHERPKLIDL
jgi:hypothetical protein